MPERDGKNKISGTGAGETTHKTNDPQKQEINRIRSRYEERDAGMPFDDWQKNIYHPRHPLGKLFREHNHDVLVHALDSVDIDLETMHVLDVGCGYGWWLRDLVELGADPGRLTGIDLSRERIEIAHKRNPGIHWIHGNSEELPFPSQSFDLVMQIVVFSSVLDTGVQNHLASEMKRVVKDNGYILWVDHKQSFSGELSGFSKDAVLALFDGFDIIHARSVHPRYFRRMYRISPALARALYRITKAGCDSWALVLKGKHAG